MSEIPLIIVAGPTASGKTALAIELARHVGGEIVNADSMQIYKYMDIGTAKPTKEERAAAVHHLIDFLEPDESYSVADYARDAHEVIADITSRGKIPVMCGGTGLYISSVADDVTFGEAETDYALREELKKTAGEKGGEYLIEMLREFDPVSAERLHPNNLKRVIRAIEFYRLTGVPISEHQAETKRKKSRYDPLIMCIEWERETLYDRINRRVDMMFDAGLVDEVKRLREMGFTRELNSMQGIGYKEVMDYLDGAATLDETKEIIKLSSRRYAKRQMTWFRRDKRVRYISADNAAVEAKRIVDDFLN